MGAILEPIVWTITQLAYIYIIVIAAEIVLHWLIAFKIVTTNNPYVARAEELLTKATKPAYEKIREKVPTVSGFDFSPFICLLLAMFIWRILFRFDLALM